MKRCRQCKIERPANGSIYCSDCLADIDPDTGAYYNEDDKDLFELLSAPVGRRLRRALEIENGDDEILMEENKNGI